MNFWDFILFVFWSYVFFSYLMVLFGIIGDIFRDHTLSGGLKAVWVIFLVFVPFLTALVYLITRGKGMSERQHEAVKQARSQTDEYIRSVASNSVTANSPADEIAKAKSLLDAGAISQAEFDDLKSKAIGVSA
ncbi:MAG: SHOCT domain-containing protein [Mycetocola sp.]